MESYWRSRIVGGVTTEDDKVAPVYKLEEICELLHASDANIVKEIADFVLKRFDKKSPSSSRRLPILRAPLPLFCSCVCGVSNFLVVRQNMAGKPIPCFVLVTSRPGFKGKARRSVFDPVPLTESGRLRDSSGVS